MRDLEEKLLSLEQNDLRMSNQGKDIIIFMDGAFDMMHYGHMNAFRQGRSLGTKLIVGVNDDESITACKGIPLPAFTSIFGACKAIFDERITIVTVEVI